MSAQEHAAIVRDRMGVCLALHGYRGYSEDCPACVSHRKGEAALEALVADNERLTAERDALLTERASAHMYFDQIESRAESAEAEVERLTACCPFCGHKWTQHDPEDGRCDAHSEEKLGVCECGRSIAWMQTKIAAISSEALCKQADERIARAALAPDDQEQG